eukprot:ctg_878.g383
MLTGGRSRQKGAVRQRSSGLVGRRVAGRRDDARQNEWRQCTDSAVRRLVVPAVHRLFSRRLGALSVSVGCTGDGMDSMAGARRETRPTPTFHRKLHHSRALCRCACVLNFLVFISVCASGVATAQCRRVSTSSEPAIASCHSPRLMRLGLPTGVMDTNCSVDTLDEHTLDHNGASLGDLLGQLVQRTYFRIFKVDLSKACPFWGGRAATCSQPDCSVLVCDPGEVPETFKCPPPALDTSSALDAASAEALGRLERPSHRHALPPFQPYLLEDGESWTAQDNDATSTTRLGGDIPRELLQDGAMRCSRGTGGADGAAGRTPARLQGGTGVLSHHQRLAHLDHHAHRTAVPPVQWQLGCESRDLPAAGARPSAAHREPVLCVCAGVARCQQSGRHSRAAHQLPHRRRGRGRRHLSPAAAGVRLAATETGLPAVPTDV